MRKIIFALTIIMTLLAISCTKTEKPVACTMEAKACPDGSFVGRVAPNCEFAPCPGQNQQGTGNAADGRSYFKTEPNCVINFMCIKGTKAFSDSTGCGCEP
jgi:hypothetical protein